MFAARPTYLSLRQGRLSLSFLSSSTSCLAHKSSNLFSRHDISSTPHLFIFPATMASGRPSAFDALMSNARLAAKKNSQSQKPLSSCSNSSPKKRKTPPTENPNQDSIVENSISTPENLPDSSNSPSALSNGKPDTPTPNEVIDAGAPPKESNSFFGLKKQRGEEKKVNMDDKVAKLKKKASDFNPKSASWWEDGEKIPFLFLARALDLISNETGRIIITDIVCNVLRTVIATTPDDLVPVVYLLGNKIAPAHEGMELGLGDASIIKALAEACGAKEDRIRKQYKDLGDLGLVAKAIRSSQSMMHQPAPLTVSKVFDTFRIIAKSSGKDSQERKKNYIKQLLVAAKDCEPLYLIRLLQTKLRIGLAEQTLLAALGQAAVYGEKHSKPPKNVQSPMEEAAKIVKQVYSVLPVYDRLIHSLLSDGVWDLAKTCMFTPGVPIGPMLAKPTKGVSEIVEKFQDMEYTCEYKYDGERAQIHFLEDGSVQIYSRNAERNTEKFPDVVDIAKRLKKPTVSSFVLDCEIVAYDREKKRIESFQKLSTRARKNVVRSEIKVDVSVFAFDLLYLNGRSLLQDQLGVRRQLLYESFEEESGYFQFATALTSNDLEEIQKFLDAAVNGSCEGLIVKTLSRDSTYEPAKRSNNWLKLKKDYMDSFGDSLDLVPIGAFHGRGKRVGVYGAFLLACYDTDKEEFQSICKIGTGFSEAVLEERSASLRTKLISNPKSYYRYGENLEPDVWFEPSEVWEVKAADLTISPVHRAAIGIVDRDKGISLRFPRLIRIREDKVPEQASSADQVAEMYSAQASTQRTNKDKVKDEAEDEVEDD